MHILVPTDFTECSSNAIHYAIKLFGTEGVKYTIVHICNFIDNTDLELQGYTKRLKELEAQLKLHFLFEGVEANLVQGEFTNGLNFCAAKYNVDLIVLGTKGASLAKAIVVGTNTKDFVEESSFPMLVVPQEVNFYPIDNLGIATLSHEEPLPEALKVITKKYQPNIRRVTVGKHDKVTELSFEKVGGQESEVIALDHYIHDDNLEQGLKKFIETYNINLLCFEFQKHDMLYRMINRNIINEFLYESPIPVFINKAS